MKNWTIIFVLSLTFLLEACQKPYPSNMTIAEKEIKSQPDSALSLLNSIGNQILNHPLSTQMYYNLLLIKAQDKCYHKHLTDSIIKKVVKYYEGKHEPDKLMEAYYYLGRVYLDIHEAPRALSAFQKAIEVSRKTQKIDVLGLIYSQTATLYAYQDIYEDALTMYRKAFKYFQLAGDTLIIPYALRDIGRMHKAMNRMDSTLFYYEKAYDYACRLNSPRRKQIVAGELSTLYIQNGQYSKAVRLLCALSNDSVPRHNLAQYYNNWGDYYQVNKQLDSATCCYLKSISYNNIYAKPHSYWKLYEIEIQKQNYSKMISYINHYCTSSDSVRLAKKTETIQKLVAMYNYQRAEKENYKLHRKAFMQRIIIISVIILFIFIYIIYYQYSYRKKCKMQEQERKLRAMKELQYQNSLQYIKDNKKKIKDLENQLYQSNQEKDSLEHILLIVQKQKLELVNSQVEAGQKEKSILISSLRSTPIYIKCYEATHNSNIKLNDSDWDDLQKAVNRAYCGFTERLFNLYSAISQIELRICLLIKIGIPVATISQLIYRTPSAVSMSRKQLYKKIFKKEGTPLELDKFIYKL